MLAKGSPERVAALGEYGFKLGVAFQLVDDLLDLTGSVERLGKPVGSDLREGKITLPVINLLKKADAATGDMVRAAVRDRELPHDRWETISRKLVEHHAIEDAYARAVTFVEEAKQALLVFPPCQEREALMALSDYVLYRDR
jgi:geranylgeranyl pyrophosphate synthase